jgi:peptide/nickel transport system permease protein
MIADTYINMDALPDDVRARWRPRIRRLRSGWDQFTESRVGVLGLAIMSVFVLWALFPEVFAPHSPEWRAYLGTGQGYMTFEQREALPHPPHLSGGITANSAESPGFVPLGTNDLGQGIATLTVYAAGNALYIGLAAGVLSSLVGVPLGLISGFYGDTWIDELIQRVTDVMYGLPFLPFLIVLVAIRGITTTNIILGIAITSWLNNCIVIRGQTLSIKERSYVESAQVAGASDTRVIFRHILPNVISLAFVYLAQDASAAIIAQASLAYLGLADFTANSWGLMLQNIQSTNYIFDAWWWLIPPGLCIALVAASFYFIGYSLEDVMTPGGA